MLPTIAAYALLLLLVPAVDPLAPLVQPDPVRRALVLLGDPAAPALVLSAPQVRDLYQRADSSPPQGLHGFRISGDPRIYVNAESDVYAEASQDPSPFNILRLAATLLHEHVHGTDGEFAATRRQADFVGGHLHLLPKSERVIAERYWARLKTRALSLALAERRLRR